MQIITKEEAELRKDEILMKIREGAVFIHPTDTIYGIGCDATNRISVKKIRDAKERHTKPLSVIAPSKEWIRDNCVITKETEKWLDKLPGPYTLILRIKNIDCVAPNVNMNLETVGVRIPDHWFSKIVEQLNIPSVTTSANIVGQEFMTSLDDLNPKIKSEIDFIIYEGEKTGRPSKIIDLSQEKLKVIER